MRLLVANVGERDLYVDVGSSHAANFCHCEWDKPDANALTARFRCQPGARHIGQSILAALDADASFAKHCRYPILKTVVNAVTQTAHLDRLLLVVTNQPESVKGEYRDRDTLYTGQVIKHLVEHDFSERVKSAELMEYTEQPGRVNTYDFFGGLLGQRLDRSTIVELHASLSGGIPSFNDSLQEQALRLYRDKCTFYEVEAPSAMDCKKGVEEGQLRPVIVKPFLKDLAISLVEPLLKRYDYRGVKEILDAFRSVRFWSQEVDQVRGHAESRLDLNLRQAAKALQRLQDHYPYKKWYSEVYQPTLFGQLKEMYFVAGVRFENREYPDLLWRIAAFHENSLRYLAFKLLGVQILDGVKPLPRDGFQGDHPELHKWLLDSMAKKYLYEGRFWSTTAGFFRQLVEYASRNCNDPHWTETRELLKSLERLSKLRNRTIHTLSGVTLDNLNKSFNPLPIVKKEKGKQSSGYILPTMKRVLVNLLEPPREEQRITTSFQDINDYITSSMRE